MNIKGSGVVRNIAEIAMVIGLFLPFSVSAASNLECFLNNARVSWDGQASVDFAWAATGPVSASCKTDWDNMNRSPQEQVQNLPVPFPGKRDFSITCTDGSETKTCTKSQVFTGDEPKAPRPAECGNAHYECVSGVAEEKKNLSNQWSWLCRSGSVAMCSEQKPVSPESNEQDCLLRGFECQGGATCVGDGSLAVPALNMSCGSGRICCSADPKPCGSFSSAYGQAQCQSNACANGAKQQVSTGCQSGEYCCIPGPKEPPKVVVSVSPPTLPAGGGEVRVAWEVRNVPASNQYVSCTANNWVPSNAVNGIYIPRTGSSLQNVADTWQFGVACEISVSGTGSGDAVKYTDIATVVVGNNEPFTQCSNKGGTCRGANQGCSQGEQVIPISTYCPTGNPRDICCAVITGVSTCVDSGGECGSAACSSGEQLGSCEGGQFCCKKKVVVPPPNPIPLPPGGGAGGGAAPAPGGVAPAPAPAVDSPSLVPCGRSQDDKATAIDERKPCTVCHVVVGGQRLIQWGMNAMTVIALTVIFAMGVLYIISAGDQGMMQTAKGGIKASLIGFAIMLSAWLIVNIVLTVLVDNAKKPFDGLIKNGAFNFSCDVNSNSRGK